MGKTIANSRPGVVSGVRTGISIPAETLPLLEDGSFDKSSLRGVLRYHMDSAADVYADDPTLGTDNRARVGIAIAVHSTEFEIRKPEYNLFEPVLTTTSRTIDEHVSQPEWNLGPVVKVAGACGDASQASDEAAIAMGLGFDAILLSFSHYHNMEFGTDYTVSTLVDHVQRVSEVGPIMLFYLQPAVGGIDLPYEFWLEAAKNVDNILAVKEASFDNYKGVPVRQGIAAAGRARGDRLIPLYNGCDNLIDRPLTPIMVKDEKGEMIEVEVVGELLGERALDPRAGMLYHRRCRAIAEAAKEPGKADAYDYRQLIIEGQNWVARNRVNFDHANGYAECIETMKGVQSMQNLLRSGRTLSGSSMSNAQMQAVLESRATYSELNDDPFIAQNRHKWFKD